MASIFYSYIFCWFKSPDLNPICCLSPDERGEFPATQSAALQAAIILVHI